MSNVQQLASLLSSGAALTDEKRAEIAATLLSMSTSQTTGITPGSVPFSGLDEKQPGANIKKIDEAFIATESPTEITDLIDHCTDKAIVKKFSNCLSPVVLKHVIFNDPLLIKVLNAGVEFTTAQLKELVDSFDSMFGLDLDRIVNLGPVEEYDVKTSSTTIETKHHKPIRNYIDDRLTEECLELADKDISKLIKIHSDIDNKSCLQYFTHTIIRSICERHDRVFDSLNLSAIDGFLRIGGMLAWYRLIEHGNVGLFRYFITMEHNKSLVDYANPIPMILLILQLGHIQMLNCIQLAKLLYPGGRLDLSGYVYSSSIYEYMPAPLSDIKNPVYPIVKPYKTNSDCRKILMDLISELAVGYPTAIATIKKLCR